MVVCGKQHSAASFYEVPENRRSDTVPIEGARSPAQFIQNYQGIWGRRLKDGCGFFTFDHEGGFALQDAVGGPEAGEDCVYGGEAARARGYRCADVCENDGCACCSEKCGLASL